MTLFLQTLGESRPWSIVCSFVQYTLVYPSQSSSMALLDDQQDLAATSADQVAMPH
jgi:hypothetical protein